MLINARHQVRDESVTNEKLAGDIQLEKLLQGALLMLLDGSRELQNDWNIGGFKILGAADADSPTGLVTKNQLDNAVAGFDYVAPVRLLSTDNVDIATGGLIDVDGVPVVAGDRVALVGQTNLTENGVYVAAEGTWSRATDVDESHELNHGIAFFVMAGNTYTNSGWWSTAQEITIGSTEIQFIEFNKPIFKFGQAFTQTGNNVTLNIDSEGGLYLTSGGLAVKLDDAALEVTANGLRIKAGGITADHLADNIPLSKLSNHGELLLRDGSVAWTGSHNADGHKLTNLANGTADTDAATVGQIPMPRIDSLTGVKDGVNAEFTLPATPRTETPVLVLWNGQGRTDFTRDAATLTLDFATSVTAEDSLVAMYFV